MDPFAEIERAERLLRATYPARVVRQWSRAQGWPTPARGHIHTGVYEIYHAWITAAIRCQEAVALQVQRARA